MEDVRNNILESPVFEFIEDGWIDWVTGVKTSSVDETDVLLYLVWGLDTLKENDKNARVRYWNLVYTAIYRHLKERKVEDDDIKYLTNLVCACTLHCVGLNLAGNYGMQDLYCEVTEGLGVNLSGVNWLKNKMAVDSGSSPLKEWVMDYMASDMFLTMSKATAWDDEKVDNLPNLVRGGVSMPAVNLTQVNIGTLHNHPGATYNDNSVNLEVQQK